MTIPFPPRDETFDFFTRLNQEKYGGSDTVNAVDVEGIAVWIQEYLRYRVNGTGHIDACIAVFQEIDRVRANDQPVPVLEPRLGVVRLVNRSWVDDTGEFFPLGTTLFWALGGMKRGEQGRVFQNVSFARELGCDYVRILGQASWPGEDIDPFWSDYPTLLATFIDTAYDLGVRTQITALTEGCADPLRAATIIRDVVNARRDKIVMLEAKNETKDAGLVVVSANVAQILGQAGLPFGVGLGDASIETIEAESNKCQATVAFFHQERNPADDGARNVRQSWDMKAFNRAVCANEPPGPASSGSQENRPTRLAAMRAADTVCGAGAFCLHTGSGVFGRPMTGSYGTRYANLWEIPGIRVMAAAVHASVRHLPAGVTGWAKFNTQHPVVVKSGQVNKLYGAKTGSQFVEIAIGCIAPTTFKAVVPCAVLFADSETGRVIAERQMNPGDEQLTDVWAPVIVGTLV